MSGSSLTRRTADEMVKSMSSIITPMLSFTTEIGEDSDDGKLASLDTKIWVHRAGYSLNYSVKRWQQTCVYRQTVP